MNDHATTPLLERAPETDARPNVPLEPSVWKRYSPHHELPLSTLTSFALHVMVVLFAALLAAMIFRWNSSPTVPVLGHISFGDGPGGSGFGTDGPDLGASTDLKEPVTFLPDEPIAGVDLQKPLTDLPPADVIPSRVKNNSDDIDKKFALADQERRSRGIRDEGGSGLSQGDKIGDGDNRTNRRTPRDKRRERWVLTFTYRSGEDYLQQLGKLQAVLVLPDGKDKYRIFHDLSKRPPQSVVGTAEDVTRLNRIYWKDNDSEAVEALSRALELPSPPQHVWAFFPRELEDAMLEKEKAYRRMSEEELDRQRYETTFQAERQGNRWVVTVLDQKRRK